MKRFISKSHSLFNKVKNSGNTTIKQYSTNNMAVPYASLANCIVELADKNQSIRHQNQLNDKTSKLAEVFEAFEKNALLFGINIYRSRLEEGKKLLEQNNLIEARNLFGSLVTEVKKVYQKVNYTDLIDAYKQLLAEAYTYEGKTFCIGTKQKNIALTKFDEAIKLNPSYELPKKEKEAILIGRGILPVGQTLVFEDEENLKNSSQTNKL